MLSQSGSALNVAFVLSGITYSNTSGIFDVTTGSGLIAWNYAAGDFQNGTGSLVYLNLPPYTVPPSYPTTYTVDASQITGQLANANVDTYWYDFAINFTPALSGPNSRASITGNYDLTGSRPDIGFSGNFLGTIIGGTVTPYQPALSVQKSGTNVVVSWPTNYAEGYVLESALSLQSSSTWSTSSIPAGVFGQNYVVTNGIANGASRFFRLVR